MEKSNSVKVKLDKSVYIEREVCQEDDDIGLWFVSGMSKLFPSGFNTCCISFTNLAMVRGVDGIVIPTGTCHSSHVRPEQGAELYNVSVPVFLQQLIIFTVMKYKKRLLPSCMHHFKSDLIYNMDHMHNSGTEPSSVILSQTK